MFLERKQDLSIYYYLKDEILIPPYDTVLVVDGYPEQDLVIPSVAVVNQTLTIEPFELGNRRGQRIRVWNIDVFAANKAQRDEISSIIINGLEDIRIAVYDYDEGFPPTVSPTQLGVLIPSNIEILTIRIFPDLVEKLYWRSSIRFLTEYDEL